MLCLLGVTLMMLTLQYGVAAPCSAAQNASYALAIAATLSNSCARALRMPYSATFHNVMAEEGSHLTLCQPACRDDLANYTSSVPSCDEVNATINELTSLQSFCYNVTHPTMDGGACTSTDAVLVAATIGSDLWGNCSSRTAADLSLNVVSLSAYCGNPACFDNMALVHATLPNCSLSGSNPRETLLETYNCTHGDPGGRCTTADVQTLRYLGGRSIGTRCAYALNISYYTNFSTYLSIERPPGWCATTCPEYLATTLTTELPSCNLMTLPSYQRGELAPFFDMLSTAQADVASMGVAAAQVATMAKFCPVPPTPTTPTLTTPTPTPTTPAPTLTLPPTPTTSTATPVTVQLVAVALALLVV